MIKKPIFLGVPTFRNYQDMHDMGLYCKGWNDAMHEIFDSEEDKLKKLRESEIESIKESLTVYQGNKE